MRFLLILSVLVAGCGDLTGLEPNDSDAAMGTDSGVALDGGAADAGADAPPGSPEGNAVPATEAPPGFVAEGMGERIDGGDDDPLARASCFDGEDNDGAGLTDCQDSFCATLGSCCVGNGDCCSPTTIPSLPSSVDFTSCGSLDACLGSGDWAFVGTAASISERGLSPEGTASGEGGVVLLTPIDVATHRLELTLDIAPPEDCDSMSCLESIALGLVDQPPSSGEGTTIEPPVAIIYSGPRDVVSVMREGSELARLNRNDATQVTLLARSTGELSVQVGTESFALSNAFDPRALHVVLYGRTRNPGASDMRAGAVQSLQVSTELCDMPRAWGLRSTVDLTNASQPSIEGNRLAYVNADGAIALAEEVDGSWMELPGTVTHSALGDGFKRVSDPELVFDGAAWMVYFTVERDNGSTLIWRATHSDDEFIADANGFLEGSRAPTLAISQGGTQVMVVQSDSGLVPYQRSFEGIWDPIEFSLLNVVAERIGGEIGSASLVQHNRAWHLYVAARRGARWSIHLLASDEMLAWRYVGQTLAPGAEFDRVSVRAPDVYVDGSLLHLVYQAEDGVSRSLGLTTRQSTSSGRIPGVTE